MAAPIIRPFLRVYNPDYLATGVSAEEPEVVEITRLEIVGHCPLCSKPHFRPKSQLEAPIRKSCNCTIQSTKDIWQLMLVK